MRTLPQWHALLTPNGSFFTLRPSARCRLVSGHGCVVSPHCPLLPYQIGEGDEVSVHQAHFFARGGEMVAALLRSPRVRSKLASNAPSGTTSWDSAGSRERRNIPLTLGNLSGRLSAAAVPPCAVWLPGFSRSRTMCSSSSTSTKLSDFATPTVSMNSRMAPRVI